MPRQSSRTGKNEPQLRQFCKQSAEIATGLQAQIAIYLKQSMEAGEKLSPKEIAMFGRTLESCHNVGIDAVRQADKIMDLGSDLFVGGQPNPRLLPAENSTPNETIEAIKANEIWRISMLQKALTPGLENGDLEAIDRWIKLQEIKLNYIGNTPDALEVFAALVEANTLPKETLTQAYELYDSFKQNLNALILDNRGDGKGRDDTSRDDNKEDNKNTKENEQEETEQAIEIETEGDIEVVDTELN